MQFQSTPFLFKRANVMFSTGTLSSTWFQSTPFLFKRANIVGNRVRNLSRVSIHALLIQKGEPSCSHVTKLYCRVSIHALLIQKGEQISKLVRGDRDKFQSTPFLFKRANKKASSKGTAMILFQSTPFLFKRANTCIHGVLC